MDFFKGKISFKRTALIMSMAVVLVILMAISPMIYGSIVAGRSAIALQAHLRMAASDLKTWNVAGTEESLANAEADLASIRSGLQATGKWREAPWIGTRIKALEQVERSASSAISGFHDVAVIGLDVQGVLPQGRSYKDLTQEERLALFYRVNAALPKLRLAREKISIAADAWSRVPQSLLFSPIRSAIVPLADRLPEVDKTFGQVLNLMEKGAYSDLERLLESARHVQI